MNKTIIYKQVNDCLLEDMDGEVLLYNPNNATTLHLNDSSSLVWGLCNGESTVQQMIDTVCEAYPEQAAQIETDIVAALSDFLEHEIIVEVPVEVSSELPDLDEGVAEVSG